MISAAILPREAHILGFVVRSLARSMSKACQAIRWVYGLFPLVFLLLQS